MCNSCWRLLPNLSWHWEFSRNPSFVTKEPHLRLSQLFHKRANIFKESVPSSANLHRFGGAKAAQNEQKCCRKWGIECDLQRGKRQRYSAFLGAAFMKGVPGTNTGRYISLPCPISAIALELRSNLVTTTNYIHFSRKIKN